MGRQLAAAGPDVDAAAHAHRTRDAVAFQDLAEGRGPLARRGPPRL